MTKVSVVMGSRNDFSVMESACELLKVFGISYEVRILSAHRTPMEVHEYAKALKQRDVKVCIAAAGGAAHLAGVVAANTTIPVIGVPISATTLGGMDSLLSIVQMPRGIPVATMAIGVAGAANAAILAAQMIATFDEGLSEKVLQFKRDMATKVLEESYFDTYEGN